MLRVFLGVHRKWCNVYLHWKIRAYFFKTGNVKVPMYIYEWIGDNHVGISNASLLSKKEWLIKKSKMEDKQWTKEVKKSYSLEAKQEGIENKK
jgi:HKD family nuclease